MKSNQNLKKTTLHIKGMHCPSCDILIKREFEKFDNITEVKANHKTRKAEICYCGTLNKEALNKKIAPYGYSISEEQVEETAESLSKRLSDAAIIGVFLFIAYFFAQEFKLIPDFNATSGLTLTTVFILGLVASTSTCMATSGALFLATIGKIGRTGESVIQNIVPAISFNMGRVLSYAFFGFLLGIVGKTIAVNLQLGAYLNLFVSVFMVLIGLDMLKLISFASLIPAGLNKTIFQRLENRLIKNPRKTSFFLGAITYFLPCGFTQTVQVYALGLADPVKSSLLMAIFAIGTVPMLMTIGFAGSFTKSSYYPYFSKAMGMVVFVIGLLYFSNFLTLHGINVLALSTPTAQNQATDPNVVVKNGVQEINMTVNARGYSPNTFTIKSGVPVRWRVYGENVYGCQSFLQAPKIGIQQILKQGENIIEFTPKEKGEIAFTCSMGMYQGNFIVI